MLRPKITKFYAIIGNPLTHSYSSEYWNEMFKNHKLLQHHFDAMTLNKIEDFPEYIEAHPLLRGMSVTMPYKCSVMKYLDYIDPVALEIGAVNVIKFDHDSKTGKRILTGYNTDWLGFTHAIKPLLTPEHKKALILGTGGMAKAVKYALNQLGIESQYVTREKEGIMRYEDITEDVMKEHTIIMNATHVGCFPIVNQCPNIPYELITSKHIAIDAIYNPIRTLFLQQAELKGAVTKNGWDMFVEQARKAWEIIVEH